MKRPQQRVEACRFAVGVVMAVAAWSAAAALPGDECLSISNGERQRQCFVNAHREAMAARDAMGAASATAQPTATAAQPVAKSALATAPAAAAPTSRAGDADAKKEPQRFTLQVLNAGAIGRFGDGADIGEGPATLQLNRVDGETSSVANVAVLGSLRLSDPRAVTTQYWEAFGTLGWQRDSAAAVHQDDRSIAIGIAGVLGAPIRAENSNTWTPSTSWGMSARIGRQYGNYEHSSTTIGNLDADMYYMPLLYSRVPIVPSFGLLSRRINHDDGAASGDGTRHGVYFGLRTTIPVVSQVAFVTKWQVYRDLAVSDGLVKETRRYGSASLVYKFISPENEGPGVWVPSISLGWKRGSDPVGGIGSGHKAYIAFGVQLTN